jgi:iron complex transport system ATP-binding protein
MKLAAEGLSVELAGRRVLTDVACSIVPGRITGLIGPNGAGKSTLLRSLAGLVAPTAGSVTLDGRSIAGLSRRDVARAIAFLPQERTVHWPLAARAVVALGRIPHRSGPAGEGAADTRAIDEAMTAMDIVALADRPVGELSGGERARVLFARALAQRSSVIIADEPTAGLDPAHALELLELLSRLATEGRGIAIALHDLSLAARFCHDVVVLNEGRVVASGARPDVMTAERLAGVFGVGFALATLDGLPIVVPVGKRPSGGVAGRS